MQASIASFFDKLPAGQRRTALRLRETILAAFPQIEEAIKWNQLTFHYRKVNIAFIYSLSADYLNLGFFNATSLQDPQALLEGTGKRMRHLKLFPDTLIPEAQINAWFAETIIRDEFKRKQ